MKKIATLTFGFAVTALSFAQSQDQGMYQDFYIQLKPSSAQRGADWLGRFSAQSLANQLGGAMQVRALEAPASLSSPWLPADSAAREWARTLVLGYPNLIQEQSIAARLRQHADIAWFAKAGPSPKFTVAITDPYYNLIPSGNWVHPGSPATTLPRNPLALVNGSSAQASSIWQYGLDQINAPLAWDLLGTSSYFGTASLAVLDFGISRGCDSFDAFAGCAGAPKYHPDLSPNIRENLSMGCNVPDLSFGLERDLKQDVLEYIDPAFKATYDGTPALFLEGNPVRPFTADPGMPYANQAAIYQGEVETLGSPITDPAPANNSPTTFSY